MDFDAEHYPEPHGIGAYTPVVGSLWSATYDFQDGDYGWAGVNTILAISDVFLIKSVFSGYGRAVMKRGLVGGTKRYFGYGMSHNYGASVSRWKRLDVDMSGIKQHWAISQKLMDKYPWPKPIGNQPWNF